MNKTTHFAYLYLQFSFTVRRSRDKWVFAIRSAISEPTYTSSAISTTSTDSADSSDTPWNGEQRFPLSVRGTADTQGRQAAADLRRNHTSPAGQFKPFTDQHSLCTQNSVPDSAEQHAQQNRRLKEMVRQTFLLFDPLKTISFCCKHTFLEDHRPNILGTSPERRPCRLYHDTHSAII